MDISIETAGLQTLLHSMLSCRCPVGEPTERALFKAYFAQRDQKLIDFSAIVRIADANPEPTPVHFLRDFCVYLQDDPTRFTITHNDVLRYFGTTYHLNRMKSLNPMLVREPATYLLSHLLVPVRVSIMGGEVEAIYRSNGTFISFKNIFMSAEFPPLVEAYYGLHMGTVVTTLSNAQAQMLERQLNLFDEIPALSKQVTRVDFCDFQYYGDYRATVATRYARHF